MHFTQKVPSNLETGKSSSQRHDTTLHGMVEISHPVNLYKACQGQPWERITVTFGATSVLTTVTVDTVMDILVPPLSFINFYAPWDVETLCTQPRLNTQSH